MRVEKKFYKENGMWYIDVTEEQLYKINNKTDLIQRIVPHLPPAEREFLMTGITDEEWQLAFADMEE